MPFYKPLLHTPDIRALAACLLLVLGSAPALAQAPSATAAAPASGCGTLDNPYGPFDYQTQKNKLSIVEQYHFTPQVEGLVGGKSSVNIGMDLEYTLRAFPNHHRALAALVRLGERQRSPQPTGASYSIDCFFERALRFRPQDTTARLLYANYLFKNQRAPDALQQMDAASAVAGDNPFTHYNLGLIYLERQHYDKALEHAHRAYALGFAQPGLREQLQRLGKWQEAVVAPQ